MKVDDKAVSVPTRRLLWSVLEAGEKRYLASIFALIFVGTVLETFSVGLMIPVLSVIASDSSEISLLFFTYTPTMDKSHLIQIAVGLMLVVFLFKNLFLAWSIWIQRGFLTRVSSRVAARLLEIYIRQPYEFHLSKNSSRLIRNAQDAPILVAGGIEPILTIVTEGLIALALVSVLVVIEPVGTVSVIGLLLLATFVFQRFFDHRLQRWGEERQAQKGLIIQTIQQGLGAVKDVRVLGRENWFITEHRDRQIVDAGLLRRINTVQAIPRLWLEIMAMTGLSGLVLIMLATGKDIDAIIPTVGLFALTAFRVLPSVNKIVSSKQGLRVSRSTIETIHHDLGLPEEADTSYRDRSFGFSEVSTTGLSFKYESSESEVISHVEVTVRSGEAVGFVGQSGSGKSTLIDIMLGLLSPQSGSVLINGQDLSLVKSAWQKSIGYIPQTIFLMDDSLRRNIAIGIADNEIDEFATREALKSAQLEDFVASLPEGLDTVVGERGVRLSGGQRQRIGIARALYHRPSVLVLDEATSSLDTETEHEVMKAVQALQGDKTVIIVAHRLSTVEYCDRLYRLDAGRIVDEGTFDEVMNRSQS